MSTTDITIKEKLSYGIGAVGKDAACALYYTYLTILSKKSPTSKVVR